MGEERKDWKSVRERVIARVYTARPAGEKRVPKSGAVIFRSIVCVCVCVSHCRDGAYGAESAYNGR